MTIRIPPLRATESCRHYSYETGLNGRGPVCAKGLDLKLGLDTCRANPTTKCLEREEFTAAEREAWNQFVTWRTHELMPKCMRALAEHGTMAPRTARVIECPMCGGELRAERYNNGHAWVWCKTEHCFGSVHFNIKRETPWPV